MMAEKKAATPLLLWRPACRQRLNLGSQSRGHLAACLPACPSGRPGWVQTSDVRKRERGIEFCRLESGLEVKAAGTNYRLLTECVESIGDRGAH